MDGVVWGSGHSEQLFLCAYFTSGVSRGGAASGTGLCPWAECPRPLGWTDTSSWGTTLAPIL